MTYDGENYVFDTSQRHTCINDNTNDNSNDTNMDSNDYATNEKHQATDIIWTLLQLHPIHLLCHRLISKYVGFFGVLNGYLW